MNARQDWYRNAGRSVFHAEAPDWIRTGRAVCGRSIARPALVLTSVGPQHVIPGNTCGACRRRLGYPAGIIAPFALARP